MIQSWKLCEIGFCLIILEALTEFKIFMTITLTDINRAVMDYYTATTKTSALLYSQTIKNKNKKVKLN